MSADEIIKYKKLLDDGVITKDQFEQKRNEILKEPSTEQSETGDLKFVFNFFLLLAAFSFAIYNSCIAR